MHGRCFVWTPTRPLAGRRTPRPGPARVCVCLLFLAGSGGPASRARSGARHLFLWPLWLSALLGPLRAGVAPVLDPIFFFRCRLPRAPFVSCLLWLPAPGAPGLDAVCFLSCWPRASRPSVRSRSFRVARLVVGCCLVVASPPPPPFVSRSFSCRRSVLFSFPLSAPLLSLAFSGFCPWLPWALALCFAFFFSPASRLSVRSRLFFSCLAVGCSLVLDAPPPLFLVSGWFRCCRSVPPFFLFSFPACAPVVFGFLWFPAPGALGLGAVFCLWASRFSAPRALSPFSVSRLAVGSSLVVAAPPHPPAAWCSVLFFFCVVRPRCLRLSLVSGPGCLGPRRCALLSLLASRFGAPCAFSPLSCLPSGRWLLPGGWCPPPPPLSRGFRRFRSVLCAV